jgi:polyhydroxyalkanoate synthesis regulator protein
METIKRYNNRKLYSTKLGKYVNISYITDLVKTGQRFEVIKFDTKEDITKKTLHACVSSLDLDFSTMVSLIKEA